MDEKIEKTNEEWRKELTPEEFEVLREKGTEAPFSGKYWDFDGKGIYRCKACKAELFSSEDKFDSKTGWPSFTRPIEEKRVIFEPDDGYGMSRTEVRCARCGSHLGHVFDDGPMPTKQRFCINSIALDKKEEN